MVVLQMKILLTKMMEVKLTIFPGSQLIAPAEALLSDGRRIKICQTDRSKKSIDAEQIYE